jgi:hypothetical protein
MVHNCEAGGWDMGINISCSKTKVVTASIGLALLHFAVFTVCYVHSAVIPSSAHDTAPRVVAGILAFPLVYATNLLSPIDIFPMAVIGNSILWGVFCVLLARAIANRMRKSGAELTETSGTGGC